jgi:dTDP-4-amino-4,6-dideoxygalactose transaminase
MIRLARPLLGELEAKALAEVLDSGWLVQGQRVRNFEELLAARIGTPHVLACSSGTAALQLAIAALKLPAGSRIAVPAYTFAAPLNAVLLASMQPILLDVDPHTYNLVPEQVLELLESPTPPAALIAVHQFGLPADLGVLLDPAEKAGMAIIEDAACALGSTLRVRGETLAAGSAGTLGCFSFHPRKVITTAEGGAVSTTDKALSERVSLLRNHGIVRDENGLSGYSEPGWNLRLSELHGALGVVQMGRLDGILADRLRIAEAYQERLSPLREYGLDLPEAPEGCTPNWQSFVVRVPARLGARFVISALREQDIETTVGAQALHLEPAYRDLPGCDAPLPGSVECAQRGLALPTPPSMSEAQIDEVVGALQQVLR